MDYEYLKHRFYGASNPAMNVSGNVFTMARLTGQIASF